MEFNGKTVSALVATATGSGDISAIDFSNFENGSFTETMASGEVVTHSVTFDDSGRPVDIDGIAITWGAAE